MNVACGPIISKFWLCCKTYAETNILKKNSQNYLKFHYNSLTLGYPKLILNIFVRDTSLRTYESALFYLGLDNGKSKSDY